ncbi:MAG TPA: hypothetical protein VGV38_19250 [Pyrinomonadaceae bacterium]|nr:hypothetical protein [Pyrinomonadaceae bacterium]
MTEDEAARTLEAFLAAHGVRAELGIGRNKIGGVMLGAAELFFEYESGELRCHALVYRFRREPKREVLEAFAQEEGRPGADTGGGRLEYRPESRALFLSRAYTVIIPEADFARDMKALADASLLWATEVAGRAADRAFHSEKQD